MMETTRKEMGTIICSSDVAQKMMIRFSKKESEEVWHLLYLCSLAKEDEMLRDSYVTAVKKATGKNFEKNKYANAEHLRRALKCKNSYEFAAKEICRHAAYVRKHTGQSFLNRRYDTSVLKECKEVVRDFMVYSTQIGVEVYLNESAAN